MGQKTSKCQPEAPHSRASRKKSNISESNTNADTNNFSDSENNDKDEVVLNGPRQGAKITLQEEHSIERWNDADNENRSPSLRSSRNRKIKESAPTEETDQFFQNTDCQNRNRVRRFRDKLANQLQRAEIQYVLDTFLRRGAFNRKEYSEIKSQLYLKWMCWRLAYILELKIRNDDLEGQTTVFDLFLECLRSSQIRRSKLAGRLSRESGDPCPSWCSDGKDEGILGFADGLILTPSLLESVLSHVHCSDHLSWWRWIPYELGLRNFISVSSDPESTEITHESEHNKLKNALYQWGTIEGFARGGLEILILCFRNHNDACEVNWRGLKTLFRSRRFST